MVSQDVRIFNDTLRNNIAYGSLHDKSDEEIMAAAKAAHVWEFAKDLPGGMNADLGQDGSLLSGGQKQRVAIARAILKDATILILDEATSALDNESEVLIQRALESVMENRTTIVIAHRLSTIENSDNIAVLENGQIIEQGNHQSLIEQGGIYAHLHSRDFEAEEDTDTY
jgi:subfamily B ATP-binding cassette protein MsbA